MENTVTREQFVAEARTWLDTPFRLQGRLKGVAIDCAGLVISTAQALGLTDFDMEGYSRPKGDMMRRISEELMDRITRDEIDAADVVLFRWGQNATHLGIMTGKNTILHAFAPNRKVVEHDMDERMWQMLDSAYHIRGIV